jgi:ADP-ribose pyrophosphatase YjhB (NUDIX family)
VTDDEGRVLLARRALEPAVGLWDTIGGFLDEGEDAVAGLRREMLEEAGIEVELGRFVGAFVGGYGDGPDAPSVLNLVWEVAIVAGDPTPGDDVAELRWFPRDALPAESELAFDWLVPCLASLDQALATDL